MMNFSYWEHKEWFSTIDFAIIGSGIVGLSCALALRKRHSKAKIVVLEKGMLPQGASTKNAGFACFGSLSELTDDLKKHTEEEVYNLVEKRWKGLQLLRKTLGDSKINFQQNKGFELFKNKTLFTKYLAEKHKINSLLKPIFKHNVFSVSTNTFGFKNIHQQYIVNTFEGQIDTGKMVAQLLRLVQQKDIKIINNITVNGFVESAKKIILNTDQSDIYVNKLFICTNGFAQHLVKEDVQPARAQVLITKPIKNLHIKGTFHLDKGYYYFRNIEDRILFGGGRNLDFTTEQTTKFGQTKIIQNKLEEFLKTTILPNINVEIDHRWSGIMGVGNQKSPIVKQLSDHVFCGIRLGGMGVAIGSLVGKELADLL